MKKIIVYCEPIDEFKLEYTAYELLSKARELKFSAKFMANAPDVHIKDCEYFVEAVVIANELNKESVLNAIKSGADKVVLLKTSDTADYTHIDIAKAFVDYFKQNPSEIIIFPATPKGRIIAPRITTMLQTGLVADCTGLEFALKKDELKLAPTRPTFGSELMATILSKKNPQCATIRPGTFNAEFVEISKINENQFIQVAMQNPSSDKKIKLFNLVNENTFNSIDFSSSKVILAGGWGICGGKNTTYIDKLKKLALKMNASFATTRKVVEAGLVDKAYQIGQTGSTVAADIYIAFGISGAIQHIQGMKNSKKIIAVNSDKDADIFKYCDYKIVADARSVIDEMLEIATR